MSAGARIAARLSPRADRDELTGIRDGVLHARVCAPPVSGEANRALCLLTARCVAVAPSNVHVIRGERARQKLIAAYPPARGVEGVEQPALLDALSA